jgi:cation:H+ antiporter
MDLILVLTGLVILLLAGDALVRGAVNLGLRAGIPALIISLTVVAFGTSAPEMLVAIKAALEGAPGIAFGNVVGSNTANILLVLGLPALLAGINSAQCRSAKSYTIMLGVSLVFIALCFTGPLGIWHGVILLAMLAAILSESVVEVRRDRRTAEEAPEGADENMSTIKIVILLGLGLAGLPLGADLLVDGAIKMARHFGVMESVIGLTIIAVGTSLPELATTVVAALRRHADVALGNVIGSNMFNLLAIMGVASFFGPLEVPPELLAVDLWVMLGATLVLAPFVFWRLDIGRVAGLGLTLAYAAYMVFLLA